MDLLLETWVKKVLDSLYKMNEFFKIVSIWEMGDRVINIF